MITIVTIKMQRNPMIVINEKNNMCKTAVKYQQRSGGTKQLSFNFLANITSHNIYNAKLAKSSNSLHFFDKPARTVRFNKTGCSDILTIQVKKLKSYYKDHIGTFIEVEGESNPIQVRESIFEINNIINKE